MGERISVRGIADADKTKRESLHAMLPNTLSPTWLMDKAIKAKRHFSKNLRQHMAG